MISFFISTARATLSGLILMPFVWSRTITTRVIKVDTVCMTEMLPLSPRVGLRTLAAGLSTLRGLIVRLLIDGLNEADNICL